MQLRLTHFDGLRLPLKPGWYELPSHLDESDLRRLLDVLVEGLSGIEDVLECGWDDLDMWSAFASTTLVCVSIPGEVEHAQITPRLAQLEVGVGLYVHRQPGRWPDTAWDERVVKSALMASLRKSLRKPQHPLAPLGVAGLPLEQLSGATSEPVELLILTEQAIAYALATRDRREAIDWQRCVRWSLARRLADRLAGAPAGLTGALLACLGGAVDGTLQRVAYPREIDELERLGLAHLDGGDVLLVPLAQHAAQAEVRELLELAGFGASQATSDKPRRARARTAAEAVLAFDQLNTIGPDDPWFVDLRSHLSDDDEKRLDDFARELQIQLERRDHSARLAIFQEAGSGGSTMLRRLLDELGARGVVGVEVRVSPLANLHFAGLLLRITLALARHCRASAQLTLSPAVLDRLWRWLGEYGLGGELRDYVRLTGLSERGPQWAAVEVLLERILARPEDDSPARRELRLELETRADELLDQVVDIVAGLRGQLSARGQRLCLHIAATEHLEPRSIEQLFLSRAEDLARLDAHLVFSVGLRDPGGTVGPVAAVFNTLSYPRENAGVEVLRAVLSARAVLDALFVEPDAFLGALAEAAGGNLGRAMALVRGACARAVERPVELLDLERVRPEVSGVRAARGTKGHKRLSALAKPPTFPQAPTPTRRALLIGAVAPDLAGVEHDLELMSEALERHGFAAADIEYVIPAPRAAIVTALEHLIAATEEGDVALIYYSGHGARIDQAYLEAARLEPDVPLSGERTFYRLLVPSDIEASTDDDFRGYTNIELSVALARLTAKTHNVVAILDCCHAGRVFRADREGPAEHMRWQDNPNYVAVRHVELGGRWARAAVQHYTRLREQLACGPEQRAAEANPWAVRLLASSAGGRAFETTCPPRKGCDHGFAGAMTLALHDALMRVDPALTTWQDIGRMIRQAPRRAATQRVSIEGPHRRFLFRLAERESRGELALDLEHAPPRLAGGRLADVMVGDRFELRSLERGVYVSATMLEVAAVESSYAEFCQPTPALDTVAPTSVCLRGRYAKARAAIEFVGLRDESPAFELLSSQVEAGGLLCLREAGEIDPLPLAGQLRIEDGRIQLWSGELAFDRARPFNIDCSPRLTAQLAAHLAEGARRLAAAVRLRALSPPDPHQALWLGSGSLDCHLVEGGHIGRVVSPRGERLAAGAPFTVVATAPPLSPGHPPQSLWLSVLALGASGTIRLLSRAPGGVEVEPGSRYILGQRAGDCGVTTRGLSLSRPPRSILASEAPLPTTILAIFSDTPVDMRGWEQAGVGRFQLRDALDPPAVYRNLQRPPPPSSGARYHIQRWELELD